MVSDKRPVVVHVVHSLEGGGTERTLVALLRAFSNGATDSRHAVVTLRAAGSLAAQLPDDVACQAIGVKGRSRWSAVRLARAIRDHNGAIIHARNTGTWIDATLAWALRPKTRLVLGFHGLEHAGPFSTKVARCARWAARLGARFTAVCGAAAHQLHEQAGVPADRITTLSNGVDLDRFTIHKPIAREALRRQLGVADTCRIVGSVGSLTPIKQHERLIEALALLNSQDSPLHLVTAGDGPLHRHLAERAAELNIEGRVHLLGHREDVPEILAGLDAYVCPSENEGSSNALLEAMAAGLPCVATDVGGNPELVRDRCEGRLVSPGAPRAIAEAIAWLFESPDRLQSVAAAARHRAESFEFCQTVRNYERYYRSLSRQGHAMQSPARPLHAPDSLLVR